MADRREFVKQVAGVAGAAGVGSVFRVQQAFAQDIASVSPPCNSDASSFAAMRDRYMLDPAITYFLTQQDKTAIRLHPQVFNAIGILSDVPEEELRDVNQRPFRSLIASFQRALEDEVLLDWISYGEDTGDLMVQRQVNKRLTPGYRCIGLFREVAQVDIVLLHEGRVTQV